MTLTEIIERALFRNSIKAAELKAGEIGYEEYRAYFEATLLSAEQDIKELVGTPSIRELKPNEQIGAGETPLSINNKKFALRIELLEGNHETSK